MLNPNAFTNTVVQFAQPLSNLVDVTPKKDVLNNMQVEDAEMRLLIADVYQHLGINPRENVRQDAQAILQYLNQEQAYQLAQEKFVTRQYQFANGSVLERFRRWIGGHPMPPQHPQQQMYGMHPQHQMQMQPPVPPMQMQMPMQQQAPIPQSPQQQYQSHAQNPTPQVESTDEVKELREQVNRLTEIMTTFMQNQGK